MRRSELKIGTLQLRSLHCVGVNKGGYHSYDEFRMKDPMKRKAVLSGITSSRGACDEVIL